MRRALFGLVFLGLGLACTGEVVDSSIDSELPAAEPAELLLILDNSSSMSDESAELVLSLGPLVSAAESVTVSTTSVDDGVLGVSEQLDEVRALVLCEATCWDVSSVPSDPSYECGTDFEVVSLQLLDCVCGFESWEGNCGSGTEEPLEVASQLAAGLPGGRAHILIVTDEGDSSRQLATGESDPELYLQAITDQGVEARFSVFGPNIDPDSGSMVCNEGGATTWGTERLFTAVERTGGVYGAVSVEGAGGCESGDLEAFVDEVVGAF